ncbi:hypothetical protein F2Q69_00053733 [Brassica cretica]|uniref:Uncharacterized protein n=1 Tax=Brassica cretica TaxID=69181 RepID=A0A8S9MST8_BRACR|nr:hypothetical protein F2Q69_00053733 [Brassica cretica]
MSSSFNFPRPTTKADDLEDVYEAYGVDRSVVLDLAGTHETPETMREGYYRAYLSFFHSCGLIFPIPKPILEILAELGLSLTQILPNFLRYLIAFLVRGREEGLSFGLSEFRQLILVKRNQHNPGTFLVSLRPGRHVIEDIPYRDEKWREQFFVFKMDRASMGEFDFSRLPRRWTENIVPIDRFGLVYVDRCLVSSVDRHKFDPPKLIKLCTSKSLSCSFCSFTTCQKSSSMMAFMWCFITSSPTPLVEASCLLIASPVCRT